MPSCTFRGFRVPLCQLIAFVVQLQCEDPPPPPEAQGPPVPARRRVGTAPRGRRRPPSVQGYHPQRMGCGLDGLGRARRRGRGEAARAHARGRHRVAAARLQLAAVDPLQLGHHRCVPRSMFVPRARLPNFDPGVKAGQSKVRAGLWGAALILAQAHRPPRGRDVDPGQEGVRDMCGPPAARRLLLLHHDVRAHTRHCAGPG